MAQARRERPTASGPAGWVVLLGLMVLALVIAAASDGCGADETSPAAQSPTATTQTGSTPAAGAAAAQQVIDQVNAVLKSGGGVPFVVGKSDLAPAGAATLDQVAVILKDNAAVKAEVRGFTDNQGDDAKNLELSRARAKSVVDYLVQKGGIAAGRLTANGFGEANPIAPNDTEAGRTQNRRVEFALT